MSHNQELENQDLRPTTTGDHSNNLPWEELPEQDLDAVSGGNPALIPFSTAAQQIVVDETTENPLPQEEVGGPVGGILDAPQATANAVDNLGNLF